MEHKCICACHGTTFNSSKLHEPVNHDTKCCENMNGFVPHKDEVEEWEIDFDRKFWSATNFNNYHFIKSEVFRKAVSEEIKSFIKTLLAHREESLRAALRKLPTYYINSEGNPAVLVESVEALLSDK